MDVKIGIIGAGLSGAIAARLLVRAGVTVTVFEKSGGTGGRLSTRRTAHGAFDHGAQYLTAKGDAFRDTLYRLVAEGGAQEWLPRGKDSNRPWIVGMPGMSGFVKPLLGGIDVRLNAKVATVSTEKDGVRIALENGAAETFDRLIVTAPAPQSHMLLGGLDPAFEEIRKAGMAPCWAVMLVYAKRLGGLPDVGRGDDDLPIAWIARNNSKPGRGGVENLIVHGGGAWSRERLTAAPGDIVDSVVEALADVAGDDARDPVDADAHRWRHARADAPLGVDFVEGCGGRVIACGDWCIGDRAEAAFDSGRRAAEHILQERLA